MEVDDFEMTTNGVEYDLLNDVVEMDDVEMSDDELERELKEIEKENESKLKEDEHNSERERKESSSDKNSEKRETINEKQETTNHNKNRTKDKIPEIYRETDDDDDRHRHRRYGHHESRNERERDRRRDSSDTKGPEIYRERNNSDRIDYKRLNKTLHVTKTSDPTIIGREIAYRLQEPKMTLFGHVVRVLGFTTTHEIFAETKEIVNRGGIKTDNGDRKRSPGGTFLYVMKNRCYATPEQVKEIFKEENDSKKKSKKKRVRAQQANVRKDMERLDAHMKNQEHNGEKKVEVGSEKNELKVAPNGSIACEKNDKRTVVESQQPGNEVVSAHQTRTFPVEAEQLEDGEVE